MAAYIYLVGIISVVVGMGGCIAGFILYKKTKNKSTLLILLGYLIGISASLFMYGGYAFNIDQKQLEMASIVAYISSPLTVVGLLIYAIKLKNDNNI